MYKKLKNIPHNNLLLQDIVNLVGEHMACYNKEIECTLDIIEFVTLFEEWDLIEEYDPNEHLKGGLTFDP